MENGFESHHIPNKPTLSYRELAWRQIVDKLGDHEREKSAEEIVTIEEANSRTSRVIESYGVQASTVALDKVRIIEAKSWVGDGHAFMSREHGIFVCETNDLNKLRTALIHEMFHYKGVNHLPIPLTEAIIERLTAQAMNLENKNLSGSEVFSGTYTYPDLRIELDSFLRTIINNAPADITSDAHTFSFFAKAHLNGRIEYLDFLNRIFRPDTLERLQQLDDDPESLRIFVRNL